jgi:hypothetical protein
VGCSVLGLMPSASNHAQVVQVVVADTEVTLDPPSVEAGIVDFVLDFERDESRHAPEGLFFVSRGGDPDAPSALSADDVEGLESGIDEGLTFDGGWGVAPMHMVLSEGLYAFVLRPDEDGSTDGSMPFALLQVLHRAAP